MVLGITRAINSYRYTIHQVYEVVADIDKYPQFVPWCVSTRRIQPPYFLKKLNKREGTDSEDPLIDAVVECWEMAAGFRLLSDSYTSKVTLFPNRSIIVQSKLRLAD